jgi:hypothetical protein
VSTDYRQPRRSVPHPRFFASGVTVILHGQTLFFLSMFVPFSPFACIEPHRRPCNDLGRPFRLILHKGPANLREAISDSSQPSGRR